MKEELEEVKQTINQRESEMREVVKTLKQFAHEKQQMEKMQDQLIHGTENTQQKIQYFQKMKDDNNKLQ